MAEDCKKIMKEDENNVELLLVSGEKERITVAFQVAPSLLRMWVKIRVNWRSTVKGEGDG